MDTKILNTDLISIRLRERSIDLKKKRLLITNFHNSEQSKDFTLPQNCEGFGRIRHFQRGTGGDWIPNPLPIDPACKALNLPETDKLQAQVFQNAICNWRCWYCFVDFKLLAGKVKYSGWRSAGDLIDLYLKSNNPPSVIDLTGGQPDLTPEWIFWMIEEITRRGLENKIYIWSDDNLSNDYFWKFLTHKEREIISNYRNYGRVCCFKGINQESFSFNTMADPSLFDKQFELLKKLILIGLDIYAYVTLTIPSERDISGQIRNFLDRLQEINRNLPLRTIPLEVKVFKPVEGRMNQNYEVAIKNQYLAIMVWIEELNKRFSQKERSDLITDIKLVK